MSSLQSTQRITGGVSVRLFGADLIVFLAVDDRDSINKNKFTLVWRVEEVALRTCGMELCPQFRKVGTAPGYIINKDRRSKGPGVICLSISHAGLFDKKIRKLIYTYCNNKIYSSLHLIVIKYISAKEDTYPRSHSRNKEKVFGIRTSLSTTSASTKRGRSVRAHSECPLMDEIQLAYKQVRFTSSVRIQNICSSNVT